MNFKSKKTQLIILGITAVISSRFLFVLFNDPEGPNLLVITWAAIIIYFLSLAVVYLLNLSGLKKIILAIIIQILIVAGLYFCLR